MKKLRAEVTPGMAEAASQSVWNFLCCLPEFKKASGIGAFASTTSEINTYPILESCLEIGKKIFLPRLTQDRKHFEFFMVTDLKNLASGPFGIPEPDALYPSKWEELDLVLVPGLAFDKAGNRLGYGMGYYDQALPRLRKNCLTVGVTYSFQIINQVPNTPSDVPVQALLTEKGFQSCG